VNRAVFLDRDGVINKCAPPHQYVTTVEQFEFLPDVLNALAFLAEHYTGKIIIVSNQAYIGKGLVHNLSDNSPNGIVFSWMVEQIVEANGRVDGVYVCPHVPEDRCWCRKPKPGMLIQASRDLDIDLSKSIMIGDMITDIQAAWVAGVGRCYWVADRHTRGFPDSWWGHRYRVVQSLAEAVKMEIEHDNKQVPIRYARTDASRGNASRMDRPSSTSWTF
jgi:D-glycero-D-manno-heptose 1,7-bisphosphate phosphatase